MFRTSLTWAVLAIVLPAQQSADAFARTALDTGTAAAKARQVEAALLALTNAVLAADHIESASGRDAVGVPALAAAEKIDRDVGDRLEVLRRVRARLENLTRGLLEKKLPRTAAEFARLLEQVDPWLGRKLGGAERSGGDFQRDTSLRHQLQNDRSAESDQLRNAALRQLREEPLLRDWLAARGELAVALQDLAFADAKRKWHTLAKRGLDLASAIDARSLDTKRVASTLQKAEAAIEKARYAAAKGCMAEFRKESEVIGKPKWKLRGKQWQSPVHGPEAIVISERRFVGPHQIEVDAEIVRRGARFQLVFGWRDVTSFYAVELERPVQGTWIGRLVQVDGGARRELQQVAGPNRTSVRTVNGKTFDDALGMVRLTVSVEEGRARATVHGEPIEIELPKKVLDAGVAFGLRLPQVAAAEAEEVVTIANLIFREVDAGQSR